MAARAPGVAMAMAPGQQQQFAVKEYDVTDCGLQILCCGSKILTLEPEEAVLNTKTCIDTNTKRLPYGDLGSVEKLQACGCCASFNSNLSADSEDGKVPISPGCGCSGPLVTEIVEELKARMKARGNTGNILRAEEAIKIMERMSAQVDAMLAHVGIRMPAAPELPHHFSPKFPHKEYDVTDCCHRICTCMIGSKTLNLEPEEVQLVVTTCCSKSTSRQPYGELDNVTVLKSCGCFAGATLAGSPGFGCQNEKVDEIVAELQERMKARGETGNIQRQEDTLMYAREQDARVDEICRKFGVQMQQAPLLQTMG